MLDLVSKSISQSVSTSVHPSIRHIYFVFYYRGSPWTGGGGTLPVDKYAKDIPFLDKYATERWEVSVYLYKVFVPLIEQNKVYLHTMDMLLSFITWLFSCGGICHKIWRVK